MAKPPQPSPHDSTPPALTLIDGYNLIYAVGVGGRVAGRGDLERVRAALLQLLAESLPAEEAARTVVVFDASRPPPGLPRTAREHGITVHFAADHEDADALLEELIARHAAPRQLTVVSSDHRLQQAARRRKARGVDSDVWYEELLRNRQERAQGLTAPVAHPEKPSGQTPAEEIAYWLDQFGDPADVADDAPSAGPATAPSGQPAKPPKSRRAARPQRRRQDKSRRPRRKPADEQPLDPFPPGYGDDVWEEEQKDRPGGG